MTTLADELPRQQARAREVLEAYRSIGPAGFFGAAMIEAELKRADLAAASGDVVAMLRACAALKEIKA